MSEHSPSFGPGGGGYQGGDPKAQAKAEKAYRKAQRPFYKKKRFILPIALLALIVIIVASSRSGGGGSTTADPTPAPVASSVPSAAPTTPASTTVPVTFTVTSDAPMGTISYLAMQQDGVQQKQANGEQSPWSVTEQVDEGLFGSGVGAVGLTAQAGQGATTITCKIDVPGKASITNTSTGQYAVVSCNVS